MSEKLPTIDEFLKHYVNNSVYESLAKAHLTRIIAAERLKEADWFIDVRDKALKNGSYPDHAVIAKHYDQLTHQANGETV